MAAVSPPPPELTLAEYTQLLKTDRLIVQFVSGWDPASKIFACVVRKYERLFPSIKFARINVDASPALAAALQVTAVPTFVAFKRGEVLKKFTGAFEADLQKVCDDLSAF